MKLHKKLLLTLAAAFTMTTTGVIAANADDATATDNAPVAQVEDNDKPAYSDILKQAKKQLGKPYGWGAVGPYSFDCSGLTSYVYKKGAQITLPRTAQAQYTANKKVAYKNIKKGDLVFFGWSKRSISHVGIYIGNGKMIDSQNRGVITENVKAPWWHYVGAARVTDLAD